MHLDDRFRAALRERLQALEVRPLPLASHRAAAVAITLVEEGTGAALAGVPAPAGWSRAPGVLLTRRAHGLSSHAGQWALPGGRIDEGETAEAAALRELVEEAGLRLPPEQVLGTLDDYVTRSGYVITPVVVWGGEAAQLVPNPAEVASIHRIPLHAFDRADAPLLDPGEEPGRPIMRMPVGDTWIAAPTAAVLYQFLEVAIAGRTTRVAHFDQPQFARR